MFKFFKLLYKAYIFKQLDKTIAKQLELQKLIESKKDMFKNTLLKDNELYANMMSQISDLIEKDKALTQRVKKLKAKL